MRIGRYLLFDQIASGGMASVHLGRALGDEGFSRTVAIKRLHPHIAAQQGAAEMFMDEARLSARMQHRNIVATLDVVRVERELLLVMEYVHGLSLASLAAIAKTRGASIPHPIVSALMADLLGALDAAHAATDERGALLGVVHRDVSPQNVLVGADGTGRLADFGIAMAADRLQEPTTQDALKGKLFYMSPEQLCGEEIDGRTDQFAAGVVLWGLLTGRRLFEASSEGAVLAKVLEGVILPPSRYDATVPPEVDTLVLRALSRTASDRFATCGEMADALRRVLPPASPNEVARWVMDLGGDVLRARERSIAATEAAARAQPEPAPVLSVPGSVAAAPPASRGAGRRRWAVLAGLLVTALAGVGTAILAMHAHSPIPAADPPVATSAMTTNVASAGSVASAPASTTSAEAPALAKATASTPVRTPAARPAPKRGARATETTASPPSCAQLYTVDADGIRRVKPECL